MIINYDKTENKKEIQKPNKKEKRKEERPERGFQTQPEPSQYFLCHAIS